MHWSVGKDPLIINLCAITGNTDIYVASLIGSFPCKFRNHSIVTDTYCKFGTSRSLTYRHSQITGIPRFNRIPWEEFSIFQTNLTVRIYNDCCVIWIFCRIWITFHNRKYTKDLFFFTSLCKSFSFSSGNITQKFFRQPF